MNEEKRRALIPELDRLAERAEEIERELDYLLRPIRLNEQPGLVAAYNSVCRATRGLREGGDSLKREGADGIRDYVTGWHVFRQDNEGAPAPAFESVTYKGDDTWEVIMTTTTHGREKVVVHSNTATWDQVYSAERIEE